MQSDFYLGYPVKSRRSDISLSLWLLTAVAWSECGSVKIQNKMIHSFETSLEDLPPPPQTAQRTENTKRCVCVPVNLRENEHFNKHFVEQSVHNVWLCVEHFLINDIQ